MHQQTYRPAVSCLPVATKRHTFRLKFVADRRGPQKDVEFAAWDAATALLIAQKEASHRLAELWCDGRRLCAIMRTDYGIWEISS
jgi:hypothetical protein